MLHDVLPAFNDEAGGAACIELVAKHPACGGLDGHGIGERA
jgi:hypothetical protein